MSAAGRSGSTLQQWLLRLLVLAVIAGSIVPKFIGLQSQSLWLDELNVVRFLTVPFFSTDFLALIRNEPHPPGYFAFMHLITPLTGLSVLGLRFTSALCASAAVIVNFVLVRRLLGLRVAIVCTALLGMSSVGLFEAQNVRPYSLLLLAAVISTVLFARLLAEESIGVRDVAPLALADFCLAAIHYSSFFLIAAQAIVLFVLVLRRKNFAQAAAVGALIGVSIVPSVVWLFWCLGVYHAMATAQVHWKLVDLISPLRAFFGQFTILLLPLIPALSWKPGRRVLDLDARERRIVWGLLLLVGFQAAFVIAAASRHGSWMQNKNFYVVFPAGWLVLAIVVDAGRRTRMRLAPAFAAAICGVALITYLTTGYPQQRVNYYSTYRDQVRDAAVFITKNARPQDTILFGAVDMNGNRFLLVPTYLFSTTVQPDLSRWAATDIRVLPPQEERDAQLAALQRAMAGKRADGDLLIDLPHDTALLPAARDWLRAHSACVAEHALVNHVVLIARSRSEDCP